MAETNTTVTETNKAENGSTGAYGGDPTQAVKGGANLPEKAVSTSEPEQTAKTFTQAELDAIVKQRLERAAKGQPSKEEMEAFRKWQDSRKTAEQLSQEKISAAENGRADAEKKLAAAEAKCCAYSKGVTAEAVDDVIALAMAKVSDDMPIEKAIDAVIVACHAKRKKLSGKTQKIPFKMTFGYILKGIFLSM